MPLSAVLPKCSEDVTLKLRLKLMLQAALLIANTMTLIKCNEHTSLILHEGESDRMHKQADILEVESSDTLNNPHQFAKAIIKCSLTSILSIQIGDLKHAV